MGFDEALETLKAAGVSVVALQHLLDRAETTHDLSTGALAYTTSISDKWRICAVLVHSDVVLPNTTITVKFNSKTGPNYDTKIGELDFDNTKDLAFIGGENMHSATFEDGDEATVESSGTDVVGNLYITILYELLA